MNTQYLMIVLYLAGLGWLGYLASRKLQGLDDFFTGGKTLGAWVTALSTQATGESAWLLLGLTGLGAIIGFSAFWVVLGEVVGVGTAWFIMARPFKQETDKSNALTTTDYLIQRFPAQAKRIRWLSVGSLTLFCTVYAAAEIDATGAVLAHSLDWNYYIGAFAGFLIVTVYCSAGGFLAVAWTDCVQGMMMLVALLLLPVAGFWMLSLPDGLTGTLASIDPELLTALGPGDPVINSLQIVGLVSIGLGFMGTPHIFARFLAIRNQKELSHGRWIAISYTLITDSAAILIGLLGRCIYTSAGDNPVDILGAGGQNVFLTLTGDLFPPLLVGLYIAAILAAIMSTFSSLLLQAASAITCDWLYHGHKISGKGHRATTVSRYITWGLAFVAFILAVLVARYLPSHTVFWFAVFGMSGITATFSPMVLMGLFWRGYSSAGAVASMVSGFTMILLGKFWLHQLPDWGSYFEALETLPPAFLVSLISGWLVSILKPDTLPAEAANNNWHKLS